MCIQDHAGGVDNYVWNSDQSKAGYASGWVWQQSRRLDRELTHVPGCRDGQRVVVITTRDPDAQQKKVQSILHRLGCEAQVWAGRGECQAYLWLNGTGTQRVAGLLVVELLPRSQRVKAAPTAHFLPSPGSLPAAQGTSQPPQRSSDVLSTSQPRQRQVTLQQLLRRRAPPSSPATKLVTTAAPERVAVATSHSKPASGSHTSGSCSSVTHIHQARLAARGPTPAAGSRRMYRKGGRMAAMSNAPLSAVAERPVLADRPCTQTANDAMNALAGKLASAMGAQCAHSPSTPQECSAPVSPGLPAHALTAAWSCDGADASLRQPGPEAAAAAEPHGNGGTPDSAAPTSGGCACSAEHERTPAASPAARKARRKRVVFGVRALWVAEQARQQGVATTLLDTARRNCMVGCVPEPDEISWASWLPTTALFARRYCGGSDKVFLFV
jgi:ESCO1/2 acetyl-transferase